MPRMIRGGLRLSIPLALAVALGVAAKRQAPVPAPAPPSSTPCHAAAVEGSAEACSSIPPSRASLRASSADLPHTIPMVNLP